MVVKLTTKRMTTAKSVAANTTNYLNPRVFLADFFCVNHLNEIKNLCNFLHDFTNSNENLVNYVRCFMIFFEIYSNRNS